MEIIGLYRGLSQMPIIKFENKNIVLNSWNGEIYYECFEVENDLITLKMTEEIKLKPIYNKNLEIIGFEEVL